MTSLSILQTGNAKAAKLAAGAALLGALCVSPSASAATGLVAEPGAQLSQLPQSTAPGGAGPPVGPLSQTTEALVAVVDGASSEAQAAAESAGGDGSVAPGGPPAPEALRETSPPRVPPGPRPGSPTPVPVPGAGPAVHSLESPAGSPSNRARATPAGAASAADSKPARGAEVSAPARVPAAPAGSRIGPSASRPDAAAPAPRPIIRPRTGRAGDAGRLSTGGALAPGTSSAGAGAGAGAAAIAAANPSSIGWRGGSGSPDGKADSGARSPSTGRPAPLSRTRSWSESLLGVGLPSTDLSLLLLIPLLAIGLTIAEVLVAGRRRGPLDRYFRRAVAPGVWTARSRRHWHLGE